MFEKFSEEKNTVDNSFNPDKRIEKNDNLDIQNRKVFDPDARIEVKPIEQSVDGYKDDLKKNAEYPETIDFDAIKTSSFDLSSQEVCKAKRKEFDKLKESLIKQWEEMHDKEWPVYKEDVKDPDGNIIHHIGTHYDAHHIIPLHLGGKNEVENITPVQPENHRKLHGKDGNLRQIKKTLEA